VPTSIATTLLAWSATLSFSATLLGPAPARAQSAGEWRSSRQLWSETCHYCHDDRVAPELRGTGLSPQAIATAVRKGINGMPSFMPSVLSDAELAQLAEWLASQHKPPSASDGDRAARTARHGSRERPQ
jgi:mono/diheme cytochrome c family protein